MQFPSSVRPRTFPAGARAGLLAAAALFASAVAGAMSAALSWLALAAAIGAAGLAWLVLASASVALFALLVLRGVTDDFAHVALVAGLNAGALVGVAVVGIASARLVQTPRPRGLVGAAIALAAIGLWTFVAYTNYGADDSIVRELVRTLALVAVALIALNHGGSLTPSRIAAIAVWTSMVPAGTVVLEAMQNWQDVAGDFRARGSLAHPNSAGLLFAITMVLAAWRWACDGGGRRYLFALAFLGFALFLTKSMGGLAQALLTLLVFALIQGGRTNRWIMTSIVAGFVLFIVVDPFGVSRLDELESTNVRATGSREATNSLDWRIINTVHFLEAWRERPVFGHGFGSTTHLVRPLGFETHSDPLRVLVETGLLGTLMFGAVYLAWMNHLIVQWRHSTYGSFFGAMLAMFIGLSAHSLTTHATLETAPMFLVAVLVAATLTFDGKPEADARADR